MSLIPSHVAGFFPVPSTAPVPNTTPRAIHTHNVHSRVMPGLPHYPGSIDSGRVVDVNAHRRATGLPPYPLPPYPGSIDSGRVDEIWNQPTPLYDELMRTRKATSNSPYNLKLSDDQQKFVEVLSKFQSGNPACRQFFNYPTASDGTAMSFRTNSGTYYNALREAERRCAILSKFPEIGRYGDSKGGIVAYSKEKERLAKEKVELAKRLAEKREREQKLARNKIARAVPKGNLLGLGEPSPANKDLLLFPSREEELRNLFTFGNKAPFSMENLNKEHKNLSGKKTARAKRNSRKTRRNLRK